MNLFIPLLINLIPLYIIIGLGYLGARYLNVQRQTLANVALYFLVPVVIFGFVAKLELRPEYILVPVISFFLAVLIGLSFLAIGRRVYGDERANLLSMCTAMGNTGYFGLPVALLLFDARWIGLYMFMLVGITAFEATFGYYIAARGRYTVRESLIKLAKFPTLYATLAGLAANVILNKTGTHLPELFTTYWTHFKGAYVVLGMMIIGAAIGQSGRLEIAPKFLALVFAGKCVVWPLAVYVLATLDARYLHLFEPTVYQLFYLLAITPPAANIAAFAAQMDLRPEKAATTILIGIVLALVYIPLFMAWVGL
jgi:predicted permease